MKMMTALVRTESGNLTIKRDNDYMTQAEFAECLRGNGFRVLKIWSGFRTYEEVSDWHMINRGRKEKIMEQQYRIKPEFYDLWGAYEGFDTVTGDQIKDLAFEWETTVEELMEQVEEID